MTPAEAKARRAQYAHSKTPRNLAPPDWACSYDAPYFKGGQMNRDPHGSAPADQPRSSALGRTVVVEHRHYRAKD